MKKELLSFIEDYQLTLKIEIAKERGAALLAQFYHFQDESDIDFSDNTNPWIIMSDDLFDLINTKLYLIQTFDELERCNGYLDGLERMLHVAARGVIM